MDEIEELTGVPDESQSAAFGLTKKEARNRLKHIAGLCYALSCDIANLDAETEYLRMENEYLRSKLTEHGIKVPPPANSMQSINNKMARLRAKKKKP